MASIAKRANGWQAQIRKKGYPNISRRFDKKSDAEVWARNIESEMDRGIFTDRTEAEKTSFGDILNRYLLEKSPKKLGYRQEKSRINLLLKHPLSARPLATLKSSDFAEYKELRLQKVCGTTVNKELNLISKLIDTARKDWGIPMGNPTTLVSRPKNNPHRERRVTDEEVCALVGHSLSSELKSIILFAIETAMRRGEICNAKWEHLDETKSILLIPHTKTGAPRQIPLSNRALNILRSIGRRDGAIFVLKADSISQAFERTCKRANINDLHFHDLRHEAITRFFEKGLNMMEVSVISGHKTLSMLKRYTHLKAEDIAKKLV